MKEIFKTIDGYPEYQVSNTGKVKSLKFGKERVLKACNDTDGYQQVQLCRDGKIKHILVHQLVARAFIPNPDNLPFINHINEDKTNNNVTNLEWCDAKYNNNYGTRTQRTSKPVRCIETNMIFPSTKEVQRQLGFSHGNISQCCNGKLKSAYGYHWEWVIQ